MTVEGTAPTRVDLVGGTLDLWPLHSLYSCSHTVNVSIPLTTRAVVSSGHPGQGILASSHDQGVTYIAKNRAQLTSNSSSMPLVGLAIDAMWSKNIPDLNITLNSDSPKGAGLGGSSSLLISLLAALHKFQKLPIYDQDLVRMAGDIEARLIHAPVGCQDYWGAMRSGLNVITFRPGKTDVQTISGPKEQNIRDRMILAYTGESRDSALNNWDVFRQVFEKDTNLLKGFSHLAQNSVSFNNSLLQNDTIDHLLAHVKRDWDIRREIWPQLETDRSKTMSAVAKKNGADFSKLCGAGGGGVMAIFATSQFHEQIENAIEKLGATILPCRGPIAGLQLIERENE